MQVTNFAQQSYVIKYKGFHYVNPKNNKEGIDTKIYLLVIPETINSTEASKLLIDSLPYIGVKDKTTQLGPVLTMFKGQNTEGVSLLCHITENKEVNDWKKILEKTAVLASSEEERSSNSTIPKNTSDGSNPQQSTERIKKSKIKISINLPDLLATPFKTKTKLIEKQYLFIKADELQGYFNKPTERFLGIEYHFKMVLKNSETTYEVFFEIVPIKSSVVKSTNE